MMERSRWGLALTVLLAVAPLALAGCDDEPAAVSFVPPRAPAPLVVTVSAPADQAQDVPISAEIDVRVTGGTVREVRLVDRAEAAVPGTLRPEGTSWVPGRPLAHGRMYTAVVTAVAADGRTAEARTRFTTAPKPRVPAQGTGLYLFDGNTYGVAMPVVAEFLPGVPRKDRAAVQRRLFVASTPAQPGVWHWVADGTQAFYRPPAYWLPGTKLSVRLAVAGLRLSNGRYVTADRRAAVTIGREVTMDVDNSTKTMTVRRGDAVLRRIPVSLGKPSTPSSSGVLVVMEKKASTVFDTTNELPPGEAYRSRIAFAQRLTWGGEFIHAAPWSVGDQGYRNVSHGCVSIAPDQAAWLFARTLVGDPVTVRGTERKITNGNGWTAWSYSWERFVRGSALPVPAELREAGRTADPARSARTITSRL